MGVLLDAISDIHRGHIHPEDPVDVRNDPQEDTCPQAVSSSNFLMWIWGGIWFHSSKKSPVFLVFFKMEKTCSVSIVY